MRGIAFLTVVRDDTFFLKKWLSYYQGIASSPSDLVVLIDGGDPASVRLCNEHFVNAVPLPRLSNSRLVNDKQRAQFASIYASRLLQAGFEFVVASDVDEYLILCPSIDSSLYDYLKLSFCHGIPLPIGLDVISQPGDTRLLLSTPFSAQRRTCLLSKKYAKPVITNRPIRWGSGFHRIIGESPVRSSHLFLIHYGSADSFLLDLRYKKRHMNSSSWRNHHFRRMNIARVVQCVPPLETENQSHFSWRLILNVRALLSVLFLFPRYRIKKYILFPSALRGLI